MIKLSRLQFYSANALLLSWLAGCAVGPDYKKVELTLPANWDAQAQGKAFQTATPNDGSLKGNWWEMFGDAQLNVLEQQALAHNQSLVVAAEHLKQARLQLSVASAVQLPSLALTAGDARTKTSADRPVAAYGSQNQSTVQSNPQVGFTVNYEADLFGRVRRVVESATAAHAQAEADFENARLVVLSELASDYFKLRELDAEIDLVQKSVVLQQKALDFIQVRHDLNAANGLDLAQQQALLDNSKTQLILLQNQRAAAQNALSTLSGKAAPEFTLAAQVNVFNVPAFPVGVPSDVLQRRPDVASAERAMAVANANIGVARAAYYPSLMLSANGGWNSTEFSNLFNAPSILWSLGASLTQTLFDNGKTNATVGFAESGYQSTLANYRQTVLVAMQEVQTGVDASTLLDAANKQAQSAVKSSARAFELANDRYNGGLDIYLNVITAQQALLASQRQAIQIQGQQMTNAVYLVKALGGGWNGLQSKAETGKTVSTVSAN